MNVIKIIKNYSQTHDFVWYLKSWYYHQGLMWRNYDSLLLIKQSLIYKWKILTPCLLRTYMYVMCEVTQRPRHIIIYILIGKRQMKITNSPVVRVVLNKWTLVVEKWLPVGGVYFVFGSGRQGVKYPECRFCFGRLKNNSCKHLLFTLKKVSLVRLKVRRLTIFCICFSMLPWWVRTEEPA